MFGFFPFLRIDAIPDGGRCDFPLYQPGLFQFLQVLRKGTFGYRQYFRHISVITTVPCRQHLQDSHTDRVAQCLGKTGHFFLFTGKFFWGHSFIVLFANIRTIGSSSVCRKPYLSFFNPPAAFPGPGLFPPSQATLVISGSLPRQKSLTPGSPPRRDSGPPRARSGTSPSAT